jgi:hypothetical protein
MKNKIRYRHLLGWLCYTVATTSYEPLQKETSLPAGKKCACAMIFGNPQYKIYGIPYRKPL